MKPKPLDSEELAELEHEQWIEWSKNIAHSEQISSERMGRWQKLWVDYRALTEKEKEQDRKWARKVLRCIKSACEFYLKYFSNIKKFAEEQKELVTWECKELLKQYEECPYDERWQVIEEYNKWLFKLTFKVVFGGGDE